jgi:hypothetical protein
VLRLPLRRCADIPQPAGHDQAPAERAREHALPGDEPQGGLPGERPAAEARLGEVEAARRPEVDLEIAAGQGDRQSGSSTSKSTSSA